MPIVTPIDVSSTRLGRASRDNPSVVMVTATAIRGTAWPKPKCAIEYDAITAIVICSAAGRLLITRR